MVLPAYWRHNDSLDGITVRPVDAALGRAAGELMATAGIRDVVDAALVLLTHDGDVIVTSDVDDLEPLAPAAGRDVELVRV